MIINFNMFKNIFQYTKIFSWIFMIKMNYKYELFDENIIYECLIKNILDTGCIPIKFVQWIMPYLYYTFDEKNKWLLKKFEKCYESCNFHPFSFTEKKYNEIFKKNINDEYSEIVEIASGSIGQVYRVKPYYSDSYYALKIIHPNVENEINFMEMMIYIFDFCFDLTNYCPLNLKDCLYNFKNQINFINESNNILYFHEKYENNPYIIIPNIIKVSKDIIIMDYIDGKSIDETEISDYNKHKIILLLTLFTENNLHVNHFNHGDLHSGNWKIKDNNKLIIYDFGYCWKLENKNLQSIIDLTIYCSQKEKYDDDYKKTIIYNCFEYFNIEYEKNSLDKIIYQCELNKIEDFIICLIEYCIQYNVTFPKNLMNISLTYSQLGRFTENITTINQINICQSYNIFHKLLDKHLYPSIEKYGHDYVKTEHDEFKDLKKYIN
jgi:predicted unusual protein kinase regulating ubiquinone biosynthesis (AarF/ABC1/UbiB family)